jgi:hypothetical protein
VAAAFFVPILVDLCSVCAFASLGTFSSISTTVGKNIYNSKQQQCEVTETARATTREKEYYVVTTRTYKDGNIIDDQ